jgi:hypothetical protein
MTVTHPVLKKVVAACERQLELETNALTDGMHKSFEDVKASIATIAAYRDIIKVCEQVQKQEEG